MLLLSRMAVHYYRPDFTEAQAKVLIGDMVDDLHGFGVYEIEKALREYRQNAKEKFFPKSGQLIALINAAKAEANWHEKHSKPATPEFGDSRPIRWWQISRRFWKPHWRVDDIPADERQSYDRWAAARKAGDVSRETK